MKSAYLYLILAVAIVIVSVVAYFSLQGGGTTNVLSSFDNKPVPASLVSQLSVPVSEGAAIGAGISSVAASKEINSTLNVTELTLNEKPEVIYIGSEYCPYCALMRWGLVIALSRFGNFTGLEYMTSSHADVGADTPTFTFVNATYSSQYVSFVSREVSGNKLVNGSYPDLQSLNASQLAILQKYDPRGSVPFFDIANRSVLVGADYNDLTILANRNWTEIASQVHNQSSVISKALVGSANIFTAEICDANGNVPASICSQAYIQTIENELT
jgi:thiol-disulfide isomerase/thioredoxin